jgi:pimeloyl-ACP methyl ester carboxylesterase
MKTSREQQMATYVLVGGAWLGAWAWQDVTKRLRGLGHDVYPPSLTGLGDRIHLASPSVNLETHIADVVNTLESEDLRDVVLVAHSYSSVPVTSAADRAAERIAHLVFVDTAPIPDGMAFIDIYGPEGRQIVEREVAELGDGWRWPLPTWDTLENAFGASLAGLTEAHRQRFRAFASPQPFATFTQPLRLTRPDAAPRPKLAVLCEFSEAQMREMIAAGHPYALCMSGPEWRFVELPTGHWPMFSEPERLVSTLHDAGSASRTA